MLRAIVFACGAALMGLEIVAARVLAPALGNSIYVWGSVISIVLAALAIGYWLGGQAADRFDPVRVLPATIAGAAVATAVAPGSAPDSSEPPRIMARAKTRMATTPMAAATAMIRPREVPPPSPSSPPAGPNATGTERTEGLKRAPSTWSGGMQSWSRTGCR